MKINYGLMAVHIDDLDKQKMLVLHFCGYEFSPTEADRTELLKELKTDPEFGLMDTPIVILDAPETLVLDMAEEIEIATKSG